MNKKELNEKAAQIFIKERRRTEAVSHAGSRILLQNRLEWLAARFDDLLGLEWHNYIIEVIHDDEVIL